MMGYEPVASTVDYSQFPVSDDVKLIMSLTGLSGRKPDQYDEAVLRRLDRGVDHKWDVPPKVRTGLCLLRINE